MPLDDALIGKVLAVLGATAGVLIALGKLLGTFHELITALADYRGRDPEQVAAEEAAAEIHELRQRTAVLLAGQKTTAPVRERGPGPAKKARRG